MNASNPCWLHNTHMEQCIYDEKSVWGPSIWVNPIRQKKICSFDCAYCSLGLSQPTMNEVELAHFYAPDEAANQLRVHVRDLFNQKKSIDYIIISGNGEPSLHPQLSQLIDAIHQARLDLTPLTKIMIYSNGAHLSERKILQTFNFLDERIIKLDAGENEIFEKLNLSITRVQLDHIIKNTRHLRDFIAQSMFVTGRIDNSTDSAVEEWLEVLALSKPKKVLVQTVREAPRDKTIRAIPEERLLWIAQKVRKKLNIDILTEY